MKQQQLNDIIASIKDSLKHKKTVQLQGFTEAQQQLMLMLTYHRLIAEPLEKRSNLLIVLPTAKDMGPWLHFLDTVSPELAPKAENLSGSIPFYGLWGNDRFVNQNLTKRQRLYGLSLLTDVHQPAIVVTTLQGLGQKTLASSAFQEFSIRIGVHEEFSIDQLAESLEQIGYQRVSSVEEEGTYALRGGIFDVFPLNHLSPVRMEFVGDRVDSLRFFSVENQRSSSSLKNVVIAPAVEAFTPKEKRKDQAQKIFNSLLEMDIEQSDRDGMMNSFLQGYQFSGIDMFYPLLRESSVPSYSYLTSSDILFFPKPIESCLEAYKEFIEELDESLEKDLATKRPVISWHDHFCNLEEIKEYVASNTAVMEFGNPYTANKNTLIQITSEAALPVSTQNLSQVELFDLWVERITKLLESEHARIVVLATHQEQAERIINLLKNRSLDPHFQAGVLPELLNDRLPERSLVVGIGSIASEVWLSADQLLIIPEHVFFGKQKRHHKPASKKLQNYLSSFKELKVGGLVVHLLHGVGRYLGMNSLEVGGSITEFLILEYAGGDKVYLPVDKLNLLQRYSQGTDNHATAALDKLKGQGWEKRQSRVKKAVRDMAEELLRVHAERKLAERPAYNPAGDDYYKFEGEFAFEETDDQMRAINDINVDLASSNPMDRLVCGDVGFGKTEVALRAAYRVVSEGHQVIVLVPTTVLCYQHFRTFSERLGKHGIRVAQVNRFVKNLDLKVAIDGLEKGQVDVLIGTHRLLSKDIKPKRLGLLIVDEEQRFGVSHKEKLKALRAGCDVLTLTATPIPRTLHMSMLGLRDISIITTPPVDRLAVKTYVAKFDEVLIRDAIRQEVKRGGQVFFVHNRVQDIVEVRNFIKSLVPEVDIRIAHGQMSEDKLEQVIIDFLEQKFSVLLCTTIIESGIDMPKVNTLIVNRADRFGLAQLYQIRGRVGRSSRQAYAYFLTHDAEKVTDEAKQRLEVLSTHQELGAGFQIASYDLEIRGAGNLLGGEQSGHVSEVGLEMYTEMLEQAINEIRGKPTKQKVDTEIKIPISAYIPQAYIESENHRLYLYKSLFSADDAEDLYNLHNETRDRFGPIPPELGALFKVADLKRQLRDCGALSLAQTKTGAYEIKFGSLKEQQIDKILKVIMKQPQVYKLLPDYKLVIQHKSAAAQGGSQQTVSPIEAQAVLLTELIALIEPLAHSLDELSN
jgi:transcription-repair coupling factor (superfamily II helicase)